MKFVEKLLWLSGVLLIAVYFIGTSWAESSRLDAIDAFNAQKQQKAISPSLLRWAMSAPQLPYARVERVEPTLAAQSAVVPLPTPDADGNTITVLQIPRFTAKVTVDNGTGESIPAWDLRRKL